MNRRSFFEKIVAVAALIGINIKSKAAPAEVIKSTTGYKVEIYSPPTVKSYDGFGNVQFDNLRQAQNFAYARSSLLKSSGNESGKILIRNPKGCVSQVTAWGETWSSTMCYVDREGESQIYCLQQPNWHAS